MKINKLIKVKIKNRNKLSISKDNNNKLLAKPQRKGIVLKIFNMTPKKPNSALRKVAKVLIKDYGPILAYIPGEKHSINIHNEVLICKGKIQDLVNVNYRIIRGPLDAKPPIRTTSRSKYGTPRNINK